MPSSTSSPASSKFGLAALLAGILGGPVAWLVDLDVSYALASQACRSGHLGVIRLVPCLSLLVVGGAVFAAWWSTRQTSRNAQDDGGRPDDRAHFMAVSGLVLSAVFALVIIAQAIPRFILGPCD